MLYKHTSNESFAVTLSKNEILTILFLFAGISCFMMSLFFPVFFTSTKEVHGYWILITGWLGLIFFQFAWYANPLNLLALLLTYKHPRVSILLSFLALTLASETFLFYEIPTGINQEKMYINELGVGFYIWYLAQIFFLFSVVGKFIAYRSKN